MLNFKLTVKIFIIIGSIWLISKQGCAQIGEGGKPYSFDNPTIVQTLLPTMLSIPMRATENNDSIFPKQRGYRFGEEIVTNHNLSNSGVWEELPDGSRLWRLFVRSAGAKTINLQFDDFYIPPFSRLFIYTPDFKEVAGAFTSRNNNQWNNFATSLFSGDAIVLEYLEDNRDRNASRISLSMVVHGNDPSMAKGGSYGTAKGNCHNNINCSGYYPYHLVKNAVTLILYGSNAHCSGTLINNTAQNKKPYLLTANHCTDGYNPAYFVFVFNYESIDCEGMQEDNMYSINGSTLVANGFESDFALLLLNDTIPCQYNPYYAGWDRLNLPPAQSVAIHHPHGDLKKISFASPVFSSQYDQSVSLNTHWGLLWKSGSTEGGSSGSSLLDNNLLIVGQLEGGYASCSRHDTDFFGKLAYSWTNNNSPDSNKRLDHWLDPLGTGIFYLSGYNACSLSAPPPISFVKDNLLLFPNPASQFVRFTLVSDEKMNNITIYNLFGQVVSFQNNINSLTVEMDVGHLQSGIYIAVVEVNGKNIYKKVAIEN